MPKGFFFVGFSFNPKHIQDYFAQQTHKPH